MAVDTSVKANKEITPVKPVLYKKAYRALQSEREGLTGREVMEITGVFGIWKRLSEMESLGYVETGDKRVCSVTGKTAYTWLSRPLKSLPKPFRNYLAK